MSIQILSNSTSSYMQAMCASIKLTPVQRQVALMVAAIILIDVAIYAVVKYTWWSIKQVKIIQNGEPEKWISLDKVNGQAKIIFASFLASGATVEGNFKDGQLDGHGKVTHAIGSIESEEGEYSQDDLHGPGIVKYRNGLTIEGDFDHSRITYDKWYSGQLKITYPDGTVEQGKFVNGKLKKDK